MSGTDKLKKSLREVLIKIQIFALFILFMQAAAWGIEESYNKDKTLDVPYRELSIIATKEGFYPNRLIVFKGEKVRFFVTAVGVESACFNIPDKNIFSTASPAKITEAETFFDKAGTYLFNCPNNTFSGRVMVLEKASDREESARRGLASETVKIWKPKETPSEWVQIKREELRNLKGIGSDVMDLDGNE